MMRKKKISKIIRKKNRNEIIAVEIEFYPVLFKLNGTGVIRIGKRFPDFIENSGRNDGLHILHEILHRILFLVHLKRKPEAIQCHHTEFFLTDFPQNTGECLLGIHRGSGENRLIDHVLQNILRNDHSGIGGKILQIRIFHSTESGNIASGGSAADRRNM